MVSKVRDSEMDVAGALLNSYQIDIYYIRQDLQTGLNKYSATTRIEFITAAFLIRIQLQTVKLFSAIEVIYHVFHV